MITSFSGMHTPVKPQVQFQGGAPIRRALATAGLAASAALGTHAAVVADDVAVRVEEGLVASVAALASGRWFASTTKVGTEGFDKGLLKVASTAGLLASGGFAAKQGMAMPEASMLERAFNGFTILLDMPAMYLSTKGLAKDTKGFREAESRAANFFNKKDAGWLGRRANKAEEKAAVKEVRNQRAGRSGGDDDATREMRFDVDG